MKLSFSTLGCPGWSWNEIYATAMDLGVQGIEIRGIGDKVNAPECEPFLPENIDSTVAHLNEVGMEIPALDTAAVLGVPERATVAVMEAEQYIKLASRLSSPYVRLMPTPKAEPMDVDLHLCKSLYTQLCEFAKDYNVTPLLETNGCFADSSVLASFLDDIPCDNKGALWDIHHPFRYFNESPETTVGNLGNYIKHVHVKDSVMVDGKVMYRMMGYGTIPIEQSVNALKNIGYNDYISLEWLKRWNPELQEPGIVFAHFVSYMDFIINGEK